MSEFWDKQMAHEATRLYFNKLQILIREYSLTFDRKPLNCLEIGFDVGISARAFLEFDNINLSSVDPGEVDIGKKEIGELNVGDRWKFFPQYSDDFFKSNIWTYDIIYIDGDHSYEQMKKDINNAWKFVKQGGILIAHDFLHPSNFKSDKDYGITQAVCEFVNEHNVDMKVYPPNPGLITIHKI